MAPQNDLLAAPSGCSRTRGIRAILLVLAPMVVAAAPTEAISWWLPYPWVWVSLIALSLLWAGINHNSNTSKAPRIFATTAFLFWIFCTLQQHSNNPGRGLIILLGAVAFLAFIWPLERLRRYEVEQGTSLPEQGLFLACGVAVVFGIDIWQAGTGSKPVVAAAMSVAYSVLVGLLPQAGVLRLIGRLAAILPLGAVLLMWAAPVPDLTPMGLVAPLLVLAQLIRLATIHWLAPQTTVAEPGFLDAVLVHPSRVLVLSFLSISIFGTVLLSLPLATTGNEGISWFDAAFTAVSATCVTGLSVLDTSSAFSGFGQFVVLLLIQVGGLGIMVFSAAAIVLLGKRLSLSHESAAVDIVGASGRAGLLEAIRTVLVVTVIIETAGAILLFIGFLLEGDGFGMALWRAIFTSISAFCNAGFALQSDSLVQYIDNPLIIWTVALAILIGGLSPSVIIAILAWRQPSMRTLHARLVIWATAILVLVPALVIGASEWNSTLSDLSFFDKLTNALFQSISFRTAGFNSIDPLHLHPVTWPLIIVMMFIGGSPGSIAGGAKTTTVAVLILAIGAVVRGKERIEIFGRTIPMLTVMRATATTTLAILSCCVALGALLLTQAIPLDIAIFEVVSALATVGLSQGATAMLDEVGKVVIIACMFMGRVGPLTLFVFLTSNSKEGTTCTYPEEAIPIG